MYIVSSCLAGVECRYNGKGYDYEKIKELVKNGRAVLACPEVLGGLPTPRVPSEIIKDDKGNLKVVDKEGKDVTKEFVVGAQKTLEIAKAAGATKAILKSKSPSCGYCFIYDGTFSGNLVEGNGLTADLLAKNGIEIYSENDIDNLLHILF